MTRGPQSIFKAAAGLFSTLKRESRREVQPRVVVGTLNHGAKRLLSDCFGREEASSQQTVTPEPIVAAPPPARVDAVRRAAAVKLVTLVEARARSHGLAPHMSPARADHAICLSSGGATFCTLSAKDGEVFLDLQGPAPVHALALRFDSTSASFQSPRRGVREDALTYLAKELARIAPNSATATRILGFASDAATART